MGGPVGDEPWRWAEIVAYVLVFPVLVFPVLVFPVLAPPLIWVFWRAVESGRLPQTPSGRAWARQSAAAA